MVTELRLTAGNLHMKPDIELDHGRQKRWSCRPLGPLIPRCYFVVLGVLGRPGEGLKNLGARRQHERRLGALPVTTQQLRSRHQLRCRHPEKSREGERKR